MKIINGKWVDRYGEPINDLNYKEFKDISTRVSVMYNNNITYDRINIISALKCLNKTQEKNLTILVENEKEILLNKK